jgi:hypothetical protein
MAVALDRLGHAATGQELLQVRTGACSASWQLSGLLLARLPSRGARVKRAYDATDS